MQTANSTRRHVKLFRNNRNQAIRIPVDFELPGHEAILSRDGDRLIIEPLHKKGLLALLESWHNSEQDFPNIKDKRANPEDIF